MLAVHVLDLQEIFSYQRCKILEKAKRLKATVGPHTKDSGPRKTFALSLSDKDNGGEACDVGPALHRARHFTAVASPFKSHVYLAESSLSFFMFL